MNKIKKTISELPPSDNQAYRKGNSRNRFCLYMTSEAKAWKDLVGYHFNSYEPMDGGVKVSIDITFDNNRRQDVHNRIKLTLDALQGFVYHDDNQITELVVRKHKGERQTVIEVEYEKE